VPYGVAVKGKVGRRLARYLNRSDAELARRVPAVTFTFDDAYAGACRAGAEIVESGGGRATYYVCGGLDRSRSGERKYHSADDLRRLQASGHEIASHGHDHLNYQNADSDTIRRDLELNARYLESSGIKPPRNFAYPFGCVSPRVKKVCGDHFRSSRGIQAALNSRTVDLFLLRAVPLYSSRLHAGDVEGLMAEARRSGSWLVFFGHDVTNEPNEFDMTPNLLSCAVRAAVDADLPILSINDALDHYGL
jgi:peptidoglycan/xylan/chitin deacetylase (PgdA/CDA1 family)